MENKMTSNPQDEMPEILALETAINFALNEHADFRKEQGYVNAWTDNMRTAAMKLNDFIGRKVIEKSALPRAVSGGEALDALDRLNEYAFGDEDDRKDYETVKQALTRQPVETKPVEQEEFIEKTGYVDIYDKIISSGFIITRKD